MNQSLSGGLFKYILYLGCIFFIAGCSVNKANLDDSLKVYFDKHQVDGCFSFFNNKDGKVTVYNMKYDTARFIPAASFDIVNSLIGLETGRIADEKMMVKWDGIQTMNPAWDKDFSLDTAFKVNADPFFRQIATRIGKDTMQLWLDSLHYGTGKVGLDIDSFWLNHSLRISPDEQLGLMKRLYFDQLPFQKRTQQIVRDLMSQENNTVYRISYKIAQANEDANHSICWVTGWVEENQHPYFFTLLVKADAGKPDLSAVAKNILYEILSKYGFLKGVM